MENHGKIMELCFWIFVGTLQSTRKSLINSAALKQRNGKSFLSQVVSRLYICDAATLETALVMTSN